MSEQTLTEDGTETVDNLQTGEYVIVVQTETDNHGKTVWELGSVYSSGKASCTL